MYGSINYGAALYSKESTFNEEEVNLYRPNLLEYLPPVLRDVSEFKAWNDVVGYELALLNYKREDVLKQCFIDTATWGLCLWEKEYGISTDLFKSFEERREIIKAKKRGQGTVTKKMLKETAEAFSNGECEVIEYPESYFFIIKFIGTKGIPRNLAAFKDMLEIIKPAHLGYDFQYVYTIWNLLKDKNLNWNNSKTWDSLKVYE